MALGDTEHISAVALGRYGSRLFVLHDVISMPVSARVLRSGSSLSVNVGNASARTLRACFLWTGGRGYPLGDISPNSVVSRSFEPGNSIDRRGANVVEDRARAGLWSLVAQSVNSPVVVGWLDGSPLPLAFRGAEFHRGLPPLSLVLVEAE
jgi:hypothetical protein